MCVWIREFMPFSIGEQDSFCICRSSSFSFHGKRLSLHTPATKREKESDYEIHKTYTGVHRTSPASLQLRVGDTLWLRQYRSRSSRSSVSCYSLPVDTSFFRLWDFFMNYLFVNNAIPRKGMNRNLSPQL